MLVRTIPLTQPNHTITAEPLRRETFQPFGDVIANPSPTHIPTSPSTSAELARGQLPCGGVSANQGTAIQYRAIAPASGTDYYVSAPSGRKARGRVTMFVCGARELELDGDGLEIKVLERHPFTSQTFVPLTADGKKRYLVVVAPTLRATMEDGDLPAPADGGESLPGRGMPDLAGLRAFVASGEQAVTYAAGTWHAPMIALGDGSGRDTVDFVVVQSANDVAVEDCQEVALDGDEGNRVVVRVLDRVWEKKAKL